MKSSIIQLPKKFDIEGHRGCRGLMPENTIPAFIKAVELGVTTLEMDVVITKDDEVLVSHEPFFNHEISTKANGEEIKEDEEKSFNIYRMNFEETQQFDVGIKQHPRFLQQQKIAVHKPRLKDVIDSVENYIQQYHLPPVNYNIETKTTDKTDHIFHPAPEKFIALLMQVIQEKKIANKVIIQSFDIRTLQELHRIYPTITTAYLYEGSLVSSLETRLEKIGFKPNIYSPAYQLLNKHIVSFCHNNNIKVIPWTVNNTKAATRLINMGVDGIITDYPNLFLQK